MTVVATGFEAGHEQPYHQPPRLAVVDAVGTSETTPAEEEEADAATPAAEDELEIPGFLRGLDDT